MQRLQAALHVDQSVQSKVEWHVLAEKLTGSYKDQCGVIFYDHIVKGLVDNICRLHDAGRTELLRNWTTGGLSLRFDPSQEPEWTTSFRNGDLELVCRGKAWAETEKVGLDFVSQFELPAEDPESSKWDGLTKQHLRALEDALGNVGDVVIDWSRLGRDGQEELIPALQLQLDIKGVAGPVERKVCEIMASLAANVTTLCKKHSLVAPAIQKLWTSGLIVLDVSETQRADWNVQLLGGDCVITIGPKALNGSFDSVGAGIVDMVCDDESGLPLLSAQSMLDEEQQSMDLLERLRAAVGHEFDIMVDVDFFELAAAVNAAGFGNQIGPIWCGILKALLGETEAVVLQPHAVDTILDRWGNAVLKLQFDDTMEDGGAWQCDFVDGDLILFSPMNGIEDYQTVGKDLIDRIFVVTD